MTHFGLTIFSNDVEEDTLSRLMAPYNEQPTTPLERSLCRRQASEEIDLTDEYFTGKDDAWFEDKGYLRNEEGKWCYARCPDAKWDFWGRREMDFLIDARTGGKVDQIQLKHLDLKAANDNAAAKCQEAWEDWRYLVTNREEPPRWKNDWEGFRMVAHRLGLLVCLNVDELTLEQQLNTPRKLWPRQVKPGVDRYDVYIGHQMPQERFLERFKFQFHPYRLWAYLDQDGWHAPGRIGWFAWSDETPEQLLAHGRAYYERLVRGIETTPEHWLTVVDCHI